MCCNGGVYQLFNDDEWNGDELAEDVVLHSRNDDRWTTTRRKPRQACSPRCVRLAEVRGGRIRRRRTCNLVTCCVMQLSGDGSAKDAGHIAGIRFKAHLVSFRFLSPWGSVLRSIGK